MLRVLVADDSIDSRQLLVQVLSSDSEIEVVAEARNGVEAVQLAAKLRPDLVAMDCNMPRLDGFAATKEIMIASPTPIVIFTSRNADGDLHSAMQALRVGAVALLQKPPGPPGQEFDDAACHIIATIKAMSQVKLVRHHRPTVLDRRPAMLATPRKCNARSGIIAIAASTGGPNAVQRVLSGLPPDLPAPILLVQHISQGFTSAFAAWLRTVCPFIVKVAENGEALAAGTVYVSPEDHHLGVADRSTILISAEPATDGFRPSATFLFNSVAKAFGSCATALILTGMGQDGVAGLSAIRRSGGHIIAQD